MRKWPSLDEAFWYFWSKFAEGLSCWSRKILRYLYDRVEFIFVSFQMRFRSLETCAAVAMHFEVPSIMHSVLPFFRLITRSLQWRHVAIKARSSFRLVSLSSIDLNDRFLTVLSANCTTLLLRRRSTKSLKNSKNKMGPKMEPWGTLQVRGRVSNLESSKQVICKPIEG